jgi:cytochrome c oxidase subunit 2
MLTKVHTGLEPVPGIWWKPAHKAEKMWVAIAFGWCMVLFAMMPLWHWKGGQNPSGIRRRVDPKAFYARTAEFTKQYKVGDDRGFPIVQPPAGADVYLTAMTFQWYPILQLVRGTKYRLHISSLDNLHGFSLYPLNVNFEIAPGYDYALDVTPTVAGDFRIICNEFCGIGHHTMVGRVIVLDEAGKRVSDTRNARQREGGVP